MITFCKRNKEIFFQPSLIVRQLKYAVYENGYSTRLLQCSYEVFYRGLALKSIFFFLFIFKYIVHVLTTYTYYTSLNKL